MQSSLHTFKKWADLTAAEETDKLTRLSTLLAKHHLSRIEPVSADHLFYMLKSGYTSKQSKLVVTGKVSP